MKKVFKSLAIFSILFAMVFAVTGCSKDPITAEQFKNKMKAKNYNIVDVTEQYSYSSEVSKVYIALPTNSEYQIEFYKFSSTNSAEISYSTSKDDFERLKGSSSVNTNVDLGNYSKYTLTSDGKYMVVSRIDDTLIYVNASSSYKDKIKEVLDDLGY